MCNFLLLFSMCPWPYIPTCPWDRDICCWCSVKNCKCPIICSCYVQSPMLVPWELKRCVNRPRTQRTIHSFKQWINQRRGEKRTVSRMALAKLKVRKQNICEGFSQLLSVGLTKRGTLFLCSCFLMNGLDPAFHNPHSKETSWQCHQWPP